MVTYREQGRSPATVPTRFTRHPPSQTPTAPPARVNPPPHQASPAPLCTCHDTEYELDQRDCIVHDTDDPDDWIHR